MRRLSKCDGEYSEEGVRVGDDVGFEEGLCKCEREEAGWWVGSCASVMGKKQQEGQRRCSFRVESEIRNEGESERLKDERRKRWTVGKLWPL